MSDQLNDTFNTIGNPSEGMYKEKGSKFLAFSHPVTAETEVKEWLLFYKKRYFDARHICFAYRLGAHGDVYRYNDDGEPSGTAGRPIYGQLLSFELSNVLVVVIRYFGGTKLGVSGLIHAYKEATRDALSVAEHKQELVCQNIQLYFEYPMMNAVMRLLKDESYEVVYQKFELDCEMLISVRLSNLDEAQRKLDLLYGVRYKLND